MKKIYLFLFLITSVLLFYAIPASALRDPSLVDDWYIDSLQSTVQINKDSSLLITEIITADCGNLPDKHGIFRILPTQVKTDKGIYKTPIELVSITNLEGIPYRYQTIKNSMGHTITWKIGDPDTTVIGPNIYKITYKIKNAVRFDNSENFDEFYWNLSGNYWQIDIDNFSAVILFPSEINSQNTKIYFYTGHLGEKNQDAVYSWFDDKNALIFQSIKQLLPGQGITVSVTFPKKIFTPYQPMFFEKYGDYFGYLSFLIPIFVFTYAFRVWKKYGKDPALKRPIPPEFEVPEDITPIQMGMMINSGRWMDNFITATLINLAVKKFITIKQIEKKILLFNIKDFELVKNKEGYDENRLGETEKVLLKEIFGRNDSVEISSLKRKFYKRLPAIKKAAENDFMGRGWMEEKGKSLLLKFIIIGFTLTFFSFFLFVTFTWLAVSLIISGMILVVFGFVMPKRTQKGTDLLFRINGLKRYMKMAEQYRQQFYEKENIFDKLLPYAIIFGIAKLWAKKMEQIYGKEYFATYHPAWFVGGNIGSFDANSFISQLNSITNSISSNTSSSSGAHGGGGSGGGGGGGGGGGW